MLLLPAQESRRYSSKFERWVGGFSSLGIRQDKEFKPPISALRDLPHGCTQTHTPAVPCASPAALLPVPTPVPVPAVTTWAMACEITQLRSWECKFLIQTKDQFSSVRWQPPQHPLICGWPYMSANVDLFTSGIFKVRFVYSCSDSSYSYANNKP